ncbi:DUF5615 family PIN-like protein [Sandarakinorhabdus limnophila]|uniref:DUF5615 family PIN-like protein n=1 Tax=Sandarakinorhabdus limnophila TaxID=210512 RepID=UPI0034C61B01
MRFLIDENVHSDVATLLRRHGYEVYLATEEMPRGSDDHQVAATAVNNRLILVTHDKDFRSLDKKTSDPSAHRQHGRATPAHRPTSAV